MFSITRFRFINLIVPRDVSPDVVIESQRDNINAFTHLLDAYTQCMTSSFYMALKYIIDLHNILYCNTPSQFLTTLTESEIYKSVGKSADSYKKLVYSSVNFAQYLNEWLFTKGVAFGFVYNKMNVNEFYNYADLHNTPMILGTMLTDKGHIVVRQNKLWFDPYGRPSQVLGLNNVIYDSQIQPYFHNLAFANQFMFRKESRVAWTIGIRPGWDIEFANKVKAFRYPPKEGKIYA